MKEKEFIHFSWVIGLVVITLIICSTLIFINYNSWTIRFEMDENTREAIESIEYPLSEDYIILETPDCYEQASREYLWNNGEGRHFPGSWNENMSIETKQKRIKCLEESQLEEKE